jgi:glycosyltransferase involved in cell wall biosynthesis
VIHAFYVSSYGFLGSLIEPRRLVVSAMGSDVLLGPQEAVWLKWLVQRTVSRCRRIVSVAPHLTERLIELGAEPAKISTFLRGVDVERFRPGDAPVAEREPTVICLRKLEPLYNHDVLFRAMPRILGANPRVRFLICSEGYLQGQLEEQARRLGVDHAVRFLGLVPQPDLPDLLRSASVYFSGATSDGTSVSLLEAMATGAYPVVADIPANGAWIETGQNGALFPASDSEALAAAILGALDDPEARARSAAFNRGLVCERASWSEGMKRLERIYEEAAAPMAAGAAGV